MAALSLADARVIADPFVGTITVVELLRARARQLTGDGGRAKSRRLLALRRALRPAARL